MRVAALVETEQTLGFFGDADADAFPNPTGGPIDAPKPQRSATAQIKTVKTPVNAERGGETPRAPGKVRDRNRSATAVHKVNPFQRLDRPQKNPRPYALWFGGNIQGEPGAVDEIDIGMAVRKKQGAIARGQTPESVATGVVGQIGLGLHNAAAHAPRRQIVHENRADQETCQLNRIFRQVGPTQTVDGNGAH